MGSVIGDILSEPIGVAISPVPIIAVILMLFGKPALSGLRSAQSWIALAVFVIVASISVAAPVLYYVVAGAFAEKTLSGWKTWLIANNAIVMIVLFLILGAKLICDGQVGLPG